MRSRTLRISAAEGGSEAISSSASTPEPTRQERTSSHAAGDGAEDHLGRAAADVDDADRPVDRVAERLGRADEGEPPLLLLAEDLDRDAGVLADLLGDSGAVARLAHRGGRHRADRLRAKLPREPHLGGDDLGDLVRPSRPESPPNRESPC